MPSKDFKEFGRLWLVAAGVLVVSIGLLRILNNPNEWRVKELQEQIINQHLKIYDALLAQNLVPLEMVKKINQLEAEWKEKDKQRAAAYDAIGPGGKIKDAGITTPKGRKFYEQLELFQAADRNLTNTKVAVSSEHGHQLGSTDSAREWDRLTELRSVRDQLIANRRFYEKGGWKSVFIVIVMILRIVTYLSGFLVLCGALVLVMSFFDGK